MTEPDQIDEQFSVGTHGGQWYAYRSHDPLFCFVGESAAEVAGAAQRALAIVDAALAEG